MEDPNPPMLPPGFRFQPTDEDLLNHYLRSRHLPPQSRPSSTLLQDVIKDFDIYGHDPKNLSDAACLLSADDEKRWYFFTPRAEGKLPGAAKRKARGGYWRRKGVDQPVPSRKRGAVVGMKKKFVFYSGASPSLSRTGWVMHEYELVDSEFSPSKESFALCCVFKEAKQVPVLESHDEYASNAVNNDDVNIAFKKHDKQDMLGRFLMALPDEHNGVLPEGPIDNDFLPMIQGNFSSVSVIEDAKDITNKLLEIAVPEGDFIELNDLGSPLLEGDFIELNDLLSPLPDVSLGRGENQIY
ncbi:hypothetical protein ACLOJK_035430 [Asimina triloba]